MKKSTLKYTYSKKEATAIAHPIKTVPFMLPRTRSSAPDPFVPFAVAFAAASSVAFAVPFKARSVVGTSSVTTNLAFALGVGFGTPSYVNTEWYSTPLHMMN